MTDPNKVVVNFETQGGDETLRTIKQLQDELRELQRQKAGEALAKDLGKIPNAALKANNAVDRLFEGIAQGVGQGLFDKSVDSVRSLGSVLQGLIAQTVQVGGAAEQAEIAFGTLLGSAEKGKEVIAELQEFAATTPFEFPEVRQAGQSLLSFGFTAEQLKPTLLAVGNVASGVSANFNELADIFGKAKVQGRLFGEDINQLTGRGVPIIGELAKQFGVAESEVKKLVEQGKVGFPELEKAFIALTSEGGRFFNLMENQSKSVVGRLSNLADSVTLIQTQLFKAFQPALGDAIGVVGDAIKKAGEQSQTSFDGIELVAKQLQTSLQQNPQLVQDLADALTEIVTLISSELVEQLEAITEYLRQNPDAVNEFANSVKGLTLTVKFLVDSVQLAYEQIKKFPLAGDGIKAVADTFAILGKVIDFVKQRIEALPAPIRKLLGLEDAFNPLLANLDDTGERAANAARLPAQAAQQSATETKDALKEVTDAYEQTATDIEAAEASRLKEIAQLEAEGAISTEEANKRRLASTQARIQDEIRAERQRLTALEAAGTQQGDEAEKKRQEAIAESQIRLDKLLTESYEQQVKEREKIAEDAAKKEKEAREKAIDELERSFDRATDAATAAETERLIAIQQLLNDGVIQDEEANSQKLQAARERIQSELDAERAKLEELRKLPLPTDPAEREDAEADIRDSIQRTADLTLSLLENERQQQEALKDAQLKAIQDAADAELRANERSIKSIDAKKNALDKVTKALDDQKNLLDAQADVQRSLANLQQTEGDIRVDRIQRALEIVRQLNDAEAEGANEKRQLERELQSLGFNRNSTEAQVLRARQAEEERLFELKKAALTQEFFFQRQLLEIDLQREAIAIRRANLEGRQQNLELQGSVVQAEAGLEEALLSGDQNRIANAQQTLDFARESLSISNEILAQSDQEVANLETIANLRRESLGYQQQNSLQQLEEANNAQKTATALERAEEADRRRSRRSSGSGSGARSLRSGGNFEAGEMLKVHKDEYIVPRSPGVVLSQSRSRDLAQQMLQYKTLAQNAIPRPAAIVPPIQQGGSDREVLKTLRDIKLGIEDLKKIRPTQSNQIKIEGVDRPGMTAADFLERQRRNLFRNS